MTPASNTFEIGLAGTNLAVVPTVVPVTFVADVESCVVVGLVSDELDPHGWTLADHTLERYLSTATRVKQHHGTGIQAAPQHQPVWPQCGTGG